MSKNDINYLNKIIDGSVEFVYHHTDDDTKKQMESDLIANITDLKDSVKYARKYIQDYHKNNDDVLKFSRLIITNLEDCISDFTKIGFEKTLEEFSKCYAFATLLFSFNR